MPTADHAPNADELEPLLRAALRELGIRRLVLAIHDPSFPSEASEDVGRGSPGTRAAARLLPFLRAHGFTGVQLGPQGQTSRDDPSPYDGTIFSRNVDSIPLAAFDEPEFCALIDDADRRRAGLVGTRAKPDAPADHARAHDTMHALLSQTYAAFRATRPAALVARLEAFSKENRDWLERDALYAAIAESHGGAGFRDWGHDLDVWAPAPGTEDAAARRRRELAATHASAIERYALGQLIAHDAHDRFHAAASAIGLELYADLQVGLADSDAWSLRGLLLRDYVMGAPPSRTTPSGQPWNYAVFDPRLYYASGDETRASALGPALRLLEARADKTLREYDNVRVDHPHGLVCPWVYRAGTNDPGRACREGARLFESPDLPDHPALAAFARAHADQIDRTKARHADDWVRTLDDDQVQRYAAPLALLVAAAQRHGRDPAGIACEVLSTMPYPLGRVLERLALGRFRVGQKANLDDARDVYRSENAQPRDWVMLGNHDTPTIWALVRAFDASHRSKWAHHLAARLGAEASVLAADSGLLVHAMLAELFGSRAENVSIFFADFFGYEDRYNVPGEVRPENWSLRLPAEFAAIHRERTTNLRAIDIRIALALALEARGPGDEHRTSLIAALRSVR